MKLWFASTAAAVALVSPAFAAIPKDVNWVLYVFDPDYAGGVEGTIQTFWEAGTSCDRVTIKADLSFKRVDLGALAKADGNCTGPVKEYMWHIHTKWNQPADAVSGSASYTQCAKAITGNHYDPNKACGPASEYADTPECVPRIKDYKCTPERYYESVSNCEFGDLSGKLGSLKVNKKGVAKATWTDSLYPRWGDHQPTWNIVLHAVCGSSTPRVACAVGTKMGPDHKHVKAVKATDEHEFSDDNRFVEMDNVVDANDEKEPSKALRTNEGERDDGKTDDDDDDDNDDDDDDGNTLALKIHGAGDE